MAKRPYSTNKANATQIKTETVDSANSAARVGGYLDDLNDSKIQEWDSTSAYPSGIWVVYQFALAKTLQSTSPGESPDTHPAKWDVGIVKDSAAVTQGNNKPVSSGALAQLIDSGELGGPAGTVPIADTDTPGRARRASIQEQIEGVVADAFSTPEGVFAVLDNLDFVQKSLLELINEAKVDTAEHPSERAAAVNALNIKLRELSEFYLTENFSVYGQGNYLRFLSNATGQGGYYLFAPDGAGGYKLRGSFAQYDGGGVGFADDSGKSVQLQDGALYTDAPTLRAGSTEALLRSIRRAILPTPTKPVVGLWGAQPDEITGNSADVLLTSDAVFSLLETKLNAWLTTRPGGGASSPGPVGTIYCAEVAVPSGTTDFVSVFKNALVAP